MRDKGIAHIGIGSASGENKAVDAIKEAMDSPLLETTVSGATDIIVNFSGNIGIVEAYDAVTYLTEQAGDGVNIIFGTVDNDNMGEEISITIIATGLEKAETTTPVSRFAGTAAPKLDTVNTTSLEKQERQHLLMVDRHLVDHLPSVLLSCQMQEQHHRQQSR